MQQVRPLLLKAFFLLLTFVIIVSNFLIVYNAQNDQAAVKGYLDLSRYDFGEQGMLCLDGEWQFFHGRFIAPVKYADLQTSDRPDLYITPPTVWNYYKINGKPIPGFGYGTYRMIVAGATPGMPMALKMLPQSTAYSLYIDDVLMAENGKVSSDIKDSEVEYHPDSVEFAPHSSEFVITVFISNYVYARGGMWDAPTLGTQEQIGRMDRFVLERDLFLIGCYSIVSLMFLVIFFTRPSSRARLYFALLCMITASRVIIYGAHLITQGTENFRLITFLEYGTRLWFPVLLLLIVNEELSGKIPKKFRTGLVAAVSALTAAVVALPIHIYTTFARGVMAYDFLVGLFLCVILLWPGERFFRKNKNKVFYFYGVLAIYACGVYDMYFASTSYFEMNSIGFFAALLAFAFILAITYTDALVESEKALRELEIESERKLQTELSLLQSQIRPHFLFNALSAIANVCGKDGKKAEQLILDLAYFMQASFDFSPGGKLTTLENELEFIRKYVHIEKARYGEKIRYEEQIEVPLTIQLPRLIIEPLVENAIRHGISRRKDGGKVHLHVCEAAEGIRVEVFDNGVGIPKEKLSDVYSEESRGVGLKNIQDRLVRSGGNGLTIESEQNGYTRISFTIKRED